MPNRYQNAMHSTLHSILASGISKLAYVVILESRLRTRAIPLKKTNEHKLNVTHASHINFVFLVKK